MLSGVVVDTLYTLDKVSVWLCSHVCSFAIEFMELHEVVTVMPFCVSLS